MIAQASERERLAAKIRLLVGNAYRRGRDREALRRAGFEVPTEPGSWDAYDDYIFDQFRPKVESLAGQGQEGSGPDGGLPGLDKSTALSHLQLLRGGREGTGDESGVSARKASDTGVGYGGQPARGSSNRELGQHPSNFETEES